MLTRTSENLQRKELTGYRKWRRCADLMCMNPDWDQKTLAENLHLDQSSVTRLLSPTRCSEAWQAALEEGMALSWITKPFSSLLVHATPTRVQKLLSLPSGTW